jgi:ribosomal protein S11
MEELYNAERLKEKRERELENAAIANFRISSSINNSVSNLSNNSNSSSSSSSSGKIVFNSKEKKAVDSIAVPVKIIKKKRNIDQVNKSERVEEEEQRQEDTEQSKCNQSSKTESSELLREVKAKTNIEADSPIGSSNVESSILSLIAYEDSDEE